MLGSLVEDPDGLEGRPGETKGLNLLPVRTILKAPKTTTISDFTWEGVPGSGYEIHMGETFLEDGQPLVRINARNKEACIGVDGCIRNDHRVSGTYIHGFFDHPGICGKWLEKYRH